MFDDHLPAFLDHYPFHQPPDESLPLVECQTLQAFPQARTEGLGVPKHSRHPGPFLPQGLQFSTTAPDLPLFPFQPLAPHPELLQAEEAGLIGVDQPRSLTV